jgi:hypothetical protein
MLLLKGRRKMRALARPPHMLAAVGVKTTAADLLQHSVLPSRVSVHDANPDRMDNAAHAAS